MENHTADVIILRSRFPVETNCFIPPPMTPLRATRKHMGLTFDEAVGVLHVKSEILAREEALDAPVLFKELAGISMRYFFYLNVHGNKRNRNNVSNHLTLIAARKNLFACTYAEMGRFYGYTARQWYLFEIHENLLPRDVLKQIAVDVNDLQLMQQ